MGVGWMQQPASRPGKDGRENVSGRWRVNIFFFLLVSVQSLVLPWLPVILQTSGHTSSGIGVVMACVVMASLLSVKSCLVFVTSTRSGAVRRFTLFLLLISSLAMYVVAICILPRELIFKECSRHTSHFGGQNPVPNTSLTSSLTTSEVLLQNISSSQNHSENTHAFSTTTTSSNFSKEPTIVTSASNISTVMSSVNLTSQSSTTTAELVSTMPPKTTPTMSSVVVSIATKTPSNVHALLPNLTTLGGPNLTSMETSKEIFIFPDPSSVTSESSNGGESSTLASDLIGQQDSSTTRESLIESLLNHHPGQKLHYNEISEAKERLRNRGQWLDSYEIGDKPETLSPRIDYSSRNSYQKPSNDDFSSFIPHKTIPGNDSPQNSISFYDDEDETNVDADSIEDNKMFRPKLRPTVNRNYNKFFDWKHHKLPHQRIMSRDDERTNNKQRIKRSIKHVNGMKGGKRFHFHKEVLSTPRNYFDEDEEVGITKSPAQESLGYTWLWVSILVVSASLLGSGIETSVTRLWHCYSHGYHLFHNRPRHDGGGDDLLERTLTDTFELSASGEHYGWSRMLGAGVVVAAGVLLALGCQVGLSPGWSLAGQAGLFAIGSVFTIAALLTILPVPYGSIKPPKMTRPLSLYLDDEVLWEGLRRIACPSGAAIHGALCALPALYGVLILDELSQQAPYGPALVVLGVACMLLGEGATTCCRRKLNTVLDSPGLVGLSLGSLAVQLILTHALGEGGGLWFVAVSWLSVGASQALIVISTRQNALMLATIRDQEREAWVSWCSGRVGTAAGAVLWPVVAGAWWGERSMHRLLVPVAAATAVLAVAVAVLAVLTRSRRAARRRVYHTLDLNACDADDEEHSDEEEDWLVRGAKKEGLEL